MTTMLSEKRKLNGEFEEQEIRKSQRLLNQNLGTNEKDNCEFKEPVLIDGNNLELGNLSEKDKEKEMVDSQCNQNVQNSVIQNSNLEIQNPNTNEQEIKHPELDEIKKIIETSNIQKMQQIQNLSVENSNLIDQKPTTSKDLAIQISDSLFDEIINEKVDEVKENEIYSLDKIDDLPSVDIKSIGVKGYLTQCGNAKMLKGTQDDNINQIYWIKIIVLSSKDQTKRMKITLWNDNIWSFDEKKFLYYDEVIISAVKLSVETKFNWGNLKHVGIIGKELKEVKFSKGLDLDKFNFNTLIYTSMNEIKQLSKEYDVINLLGMIVSKFDDSKPRKIILKRQGVEYVIKFWEDDLIPEFSKIQINSPYSMIGLHQKKFTPNNRLIAVYSFAYTKHSIALLLIKNN